jgi:aspartokinase
MNADIYENFTDTYGVQTANPSIVKNTHTVSEIDYDSLHKLRQAGATVIYPDCLPLLKKYETPLRIDNTFDPQKKSTFVTETKSSRPFFSITYETGANINKETAKILCLMHKMSLTVAELNEIFAGLEVYFTKYSPSEFTLLTPASNTSKIVNLLHKRLASAHI